MGERVGWGLLCHAHTLAGRAFQRVTLWKEKAMEGNSLSSVAMASRFGCESSHTCLGEDGTLSGWDPPSQAGAVLVRGLSRLTVTVSAVM